jgi:hypothetical protein
MAWAERAIKHAQEQLQAEDKAKAEAEYLTEA